MRFALNGVFIATVAPLLAAGCASERAATMNQISQEPRVVTVTVSDKVIASVDERIFGQFFERPSWGETGPEGVLDADRKLPADVVNRLAAMRIPIVRFPGGTDIDYIDWTDMISNAPTRENPERPVTVGHTGRSVTNDFGYDEYFALCDQLGWQTILVVNFLDGLSGKTPLQDAATRAAGLLAYSNAERGATLPPGMPDWPGVRAANGHPAPWKIEYVQIGNECFLKRFRETAAGAPAIVAAGGAQDAKIAWYKKALLTYARTLKAVDPDIRIIFDARLGDRDLSLAVMGDPEVRELIDYATFHSYAPMGVQPFEWGDLTDETLRDQAIFGGFSAMPGWDVDDLPAITSPEDLQVFRDWGYKLAVTEWNWNGWGYQNILGERAGMVPLASALASARYIHAMMLDRISLATQSMLVGHRWNIAAIHVDPAGERPTFQSPQAQATDLYRKHSGADLLATTTGGVAHYAQPMRLGLSAPRDGLPMVDCLATRGDGVLYLHLINHSVADAITVEVDLEAMSVDPAGEGWHWLIDGEIETLDWAGSVRTSRRPFAAAGQTVTLSLPAHTVNIFELPLK